MLTIDRQGFRLNGERYRKLWGRSSFKLANMVGYHFVGEGGGPYSLGAALRWVDHNQRLFGEHTVLRVFLETEAWDKPEGMFGSSPVDRGFWNRDALKRQSGSGVQMARLGQRVLDWFFKTSQETGVVFELVIDATLKHDPRGYSTGQIDHAIRVVGEEMGKLAQRYPRALIIPNCRNEWNAHNRTGHTLAQVNDWAERWERDQYWLGSQPIVDGGGANMFDYAVGGPGKFAMGLVHPERGSGWETLVPRVVRDLRSRSAGQPVGFNESMYYVEREDRARAEEWYRASGWTTDWSKFRQFTEDALEHCDYHIIHDEKGVQCDPAWPRAVTRVEDHFGAGGSLPPVEPPDPPDPPPNSGPFEIRVDRDEVTKVVHPPILVDEGEENVYRKGVTLQGQGRLLADIWIFHGRDRGDIAEMDTEVYAEGVVPLALRSDHHEVPASFQSWTHYSVGRFVNQVNIQVLARVNGKNPFLGNRLQIRPHWGIYLVWEGSEWFPPPDIPPDITDPPEPPDPPTEKQYVPLGDEEWKARLEHAYTEWRGHRDLAAMLGTQWVEQAGYTDREFRQLLLDMEDAQRQSRRLQHRIDVERHDFLDGRSSVRKSRARELENLLLSYTSTYTRIASTFPEVAGCDSIRCKPKEL